MSNNAKRLGGQWGWHPGTQGLPKEGDLMIVTNEGSEFFNQVVRLNEDKDGYQTVLVGDNLTSRYGLNVSLYRKDLRPLKSSDKLMVVS